MFLQRSLQKGLNVLVGAYTLSPPQVGQTTILRGCEALTAISVSRYPYRCYQCCSTSCQGRVPSAAQSQLEGRCIFAGMQAAVGFVAHQAHRHHQAVAADLGDQAQRRVDAQA